MPLVLDSISTRVKILGKDSQNQFSTQRAEFIKDIVREITTTFDWRWLYDSINITATGTWVDLPADYHKLKSVIGPSGLRIRFISEDDYFIRRQELNQDGMNYYRLKFNSTTGLFQINFVNVDSGTVTEALYKRFTDDVTKIPAPLEEPVVLGATSKFMCMLEGDDNEVARGYRNDFVYLIQQHKFLADNDQSDGPQRMKTNSEIEGQEAAIRWRDQAH